MSTQSPYLILVDDDLDFCRMATKILSAENYRVATAHKKSELDTLLQQGMPDLIVLDIGLPEVNGIEICKAIRNQSQVPIVMLTGNQEEVDKVLALEFGADNYLNKPINPRLLISHIKAILRRSAQGADDTPKKTPASSISVQSKKNIGMTQEWLEFGEFILNTTNQTLQSQARGNIPITTNEYHLLYIFANNYDRVLSRERLMDLLGSDSENLDRGIDIAISRLRKKIEKDPKSPEVIKTIRQTGYLFSLPVSKKVVELG